MSTVLSMSKLAMQKKKRYIYHRQSKQLCIVRSIWVVYYSMIPEESILATKFITIFWQDNFIFILSRWFYIYKYYKFANTYRNSLLDM